MNPNDYNNCTCRALAHAANIELHVATRIAADAGRKHRRGFHSAKLIKEARKNGIAIRKLKFKRRRTLARFLNEYPEGRFYAHGRGHAFAIINGEVFGEDKMGKLVTAAWQILNVREATWPERLAEIMPCRLMQAAIALDTSYRVIQCAAMTLVRQKKARWYRKKLIAI